MSGPELRTERLVLDGWDMRTVRQHDSTLVGRCGIAVHELEHGSEREIGDILGREHGGKGSAKDAASAMRDGAIGRGERRLVALIRPGNDASVRVAEKLGMAFDRDVPLHDRPTLLFAMEV